jgi:hypothetical protein
LVFEPGGVLKLVCYILMQSDKVIVIESGGISTVDFCELLEFGNGTIIDVVIQNYDIIRVI